MARARASSQIGPSCLLAASTISASEYLPSRIICPSWRPTRARSYGSTPPASRLTAGSSSMPAPLLNPTRAVKSRNVLVAGVIRPAQRPAASFCPSRWYLRAIASWKGIHGVGPYFPMSSTIFDHQSTRLRGSLKSTPVRPLSGLMAASRLNHRGCSESRPSSSLVLS